MQIFLVSAIIFFRGICQSQKYFFKMSSCYQTLIFLIIHKEIEINAKIKNILK